MAKSDFTDMPEGTYTLDETHASLVWKVSHMGLSNYTALFTEFDASIAFDPADISQSRVTATVDANSVETHYPHPKETDFNAELANSDSWFNAKQYPVIRFESTDIEMHSARQASMTGNLTMRGVTKPVTFDVTLNGAMALQPLSGKPTLGFSATTTLNRSDWGMTKHIPTVGDAVTVTIEAEFARQ
ncbi:polyisoprenoid-binding protein [Alteromonas halophila]|uniref:Polyisoprenoid-binding protein n=2 Tax=Alteromonas halophila TaxID=516698 RepID=A0A918JF67_9ALTE|nr:polyisoprenoid-binding protein [Alteromonas halophila]